MVIGRRWLVGLLVLAGAQGHAMAPGPADEAGDDDGISTEVHHLKRGPVRSVVIRFDGRRPLPSRTVLKGCDKFILSKAMVAQYFAKATQVSAAAYKHDNDWSPCDATGTARFADGRTFAWNIQQLGSGWLVLKQRKYYFNCEDCALTGLGYSEPGGPP